MLHSYLVPYTQTLCLIGTVDIVYGAGSMHRSGICSSLCLSICPSVPSGCWCRFAVCCWGPGEQVHRSIAAQLACSGWMSAVPHCQLNTDLFCMGRRFVKGVGVSSWMWTVGVQPTSPQTPCSQRLMTYTAVGQFGSYFSWFWVSLAACVLTTMCGQHQRSYCICIIVKLHLVIILSKSS